MSGVDPLLALDRAARAGELGDGDLVLAARRRHRLHVGRERRALGAACVIERRRASSARALARDRRRSGSTRSRTATEDHQWIHVDPERPRPARSGRRSRTAS